MVDSSYQPAVYRKQGGNEQVIASGGKVTLESGSILDFESGSALKIAGVAVSSTAAELNALDGAPLLATFVVGAETGGNTINVSIALKDAGGTAIAVRGSVFAYMSDDANGDAIAAAAASGGVAIGTDGLAIPVVAAKAFQLVSESDGHIDVNVVEAAGATWYLVVVLPTGKLAVSGAITFAA